MKRTARFLAGSTARMAFKVALVAIALTATLTMAGSAPCIRAEIDQRVILPDGTSYPPGTLRLCLDREYSPVAGLHRTSMDGLTAGLFVSRNTVSEGEVDLARDAMMIFRRVPGVGLSLAGYAVPHKGHIRVYWMEQACTSRTTARAMPEDLDIATVSLEGFEDIEIVVASPR